MTSLFGQFSNCRPNPSAVVLTCELVANCAFTVQTADADTTQLDSCVASALAVCIGLLVTVGSISRKSLAQLLR